MFRLEIENIDWAPVLQCTGADKAYAIFMEIFIDTRQVV